MSIEDINYLKKTSIKQSYTFLVDSKNRDRRIYPHPSEYSVDFTVPFKNVIGLEVVDVSVPKTMYNIDINNNKLYYYIADSDNADLSVAIIKDKDGNDTYDETLFSCIEIAPGDYNTNTFIDYIRNLFFTKGINMDLNAVDNPPELTNTIYFKSPKPFILDMNKSTIAEVLGFDLHTSPNETIKYKYNSLYNHKIGFEKLYHSIVTETGINVVIAPGMMYLIGNKYLVLKCPEIEAHLYRSLSYSKYNLGLAKIRINSYGYNDEKTSFLKVPLREFHPIGKLSKITLRFETDEGKIYDFKGVNHNIVFAIYYYEPRQENIVKTSILNPEYNPNFIDYLYLQEEQEGESDEDEEDFSRDNIDIYKKRELEFNKQSIENRNSIIAFNKREQDKKNKNQNQLLIDKVKKLSFSSDDE